MLMPATDTATDGNERLYPQPLLRERWDRETVFRLNVSTSTNRMVAYFVHPSSVVALALCYGDS